MKAITKKETKRLEQLLKRHVEFMTNATVDFRDYYIGEVIDQHRAALSNSIQNLYQEIKKTDDKQRLEGLERAYQTQRTTANRINLFALKNGRLADKVFTEKINYVSEKLTERNYGQYPTGLELKAVKDAGYKGLEYLIHEFEAERRGGEVVDGNWVDLYYVKVYTRTLHARVTWVEGHARMNQVSAGFHMVNPHFRFIITERKA